MGLPEKKTTKSGFEFQLGVNHMGHFYLTHLLWEKLNKAEFFKIINASSMVHKGVLGYKAYSLNFEDMNF